MSYLEKAKAMLVDNWKAKDTISNLEARIRQLEEGKDPKEKKPTKEEVKEVKQPEKKMKGKVQLSDEDFNDLKKELTEG